MKIFHLAYIIQIWHPCVVYNRNNSPERGLSPEGVARGRQSSRGGVIPVEHHTGMSYLFYYTEQNTKHKRGKMTNTRNFGWILFCKKITNYNNRDVQLLHWRIRVQQKPQHVQQEKIFSLASSQLDLNLEIRAFIK